MQKYGGVVILMSDVKYLIGNSELNRTAFQTYDTNVCEFLSEISANLLKSPIVITYPALSALAFWARKANITKLKSDFGNTEDRMGRGLCFHITPSNIPINFAFSYFFSLLAGNANIVRLPSKEFPQIDIISNLLKEILPRYPEIEKRTAFIKYPRDNDITAQLCSLADARMIWGGDKTIAMVKSMPCQPRCVDISFADRYSVCIIDGQKILETTPDNIKRLAENFYNDTYLMDQNACSSPQIILWQNDSLRAREIFWNAVIKEASVKYNLQDAVVVDKYTHACIDAVDLSNFQKLNRFKNLAYRIEINKLTPEIIKNRGNGGYFYEHSLRSWEELFSVTTEKFQTVTHYGLSEKDFRQAIINNNVRGIDRIVPIGKAMDIGPYWDGHDLIRELSRKIALS